MSGQKDRRVTRCKICGFRSPLFALVDAGKTCSQDDAYPFGLFGEPVYYARCGDCGFVFTTKFDDWSVLRWSTEVYNGDYERVDPDFLYLRPKANADWLAGKIGVDLRDVEVLDFGSGNGKTEEFLRSHGFGHVVSFDPVFHPAAPGRKFDLVVAFEVVEHSPDPIGSFRRMIGFMKPAGILVFQTCLTPSDLDVIRSGWWYMSPRNGHVSLYSPRSVQVLAQSNGLVSLTDGVVSCMYDAGIVSTASIGALRLIESFVGWPKCDCDYAVLAEGAWHHQEVAYPDALPFRWTSDADGATLVIARPAGFSGIFALAVTVLMTAEGVDDVSVLPEDDCGIDVVSCDRDGLVHHLVLRADWTRRVRLSVRTSTVVIPTNGDLRSLGVAILRPVLTMPHDVDTLFIPQDSAARA